MPFSCPASSACVRFQIRLLNWILLANMGFGLVFVFCRLAELIATPPYWTQVLLQACCSFWRYGLGVRTAPRRAYVAVATVAAGGAYAYFSMHALL